MLNPTERVSENKDEINKREHIRFDCDRYQENKHDKVFENKHHSFRETNLVFHRDRLFQNLFKQKKQRM